MIDCLLNKPVALEILNFPDDIKEHIQSKLKVNILYLESVVFEPYKDDEGGITEIDNTSSYESVYYTAIALLGEAATNGNDRMQKNEEQVWDIFATSVLCYYKVSS